MAMTKEHVGRFTRKLYRFLDEGHDFKFRRMSKLRGHIFVDHYPTEVHLDHTHNVLSTLIHEALHYLYPKASETWVVRMERTIVSKLTDRQVKNILKRWASNM